jgi:hypothetical protein
VVSAGLPCTRSVRGACMLWCVGGCAVCGQLAVRRL